MNAVADPGRARAQRPDPSVQVVRVFEAIHASRMQGMPLLNPALRVEAVGFRRWQGRWLGVLITPWFMNLMLLPDDAAAWQRLPPRAALGYVLPAGVFEFIGGHEPQLGDYQSCSLFSPVFEFADQDGARATALAALEALFDTAAHAGAEGPTTAAPAPGAAPAPAAMTKRDFLRGRWQGDAPRADGLPPSP